MASAPLDVELQKPLARAIRAGHPWIYDGALARNADVKMGQLVRVVDRTGPLALGYGDPSSPIRVRVLDLDSDAAIDDGWVAERAQAAARLRAGDSRLTTTDALRLIHGEGDRMPGLVIDRYADVLVVSTDGPAAAAFWIPRLSAAMDGLAAAGHPVQRVWLRSRSKKGRPLAGTAPVEPVVIREGAARFEVDVVRGQKTGFFLDQRHNREYVGRRTAGQAVLNLFGYTGGFSVHAALGKARTVVTIDSSQPAIDAATRNFALSGIAGGRHEEVCADAFAWLEQAAAQGRRFDNVVCDPPSFAPRASALDAARAAYRRINRMAMQLVGPGGSLFSASCSSHMTRADLRTAVAGAASDIGRTGVIVTELGAGSDHPVLPAFPEGDYLKFFHVVVS